MSNSFAFTEEYQAKALSMMLHDPAFAAVMRDSVSQEHFSNRALQWFFNRLKDHEKTHSPITLKEELVTAVKAKAVKEEELPKYVDIYNIIKNDPSPAEKRHLKETLSKFVRTQAVKKAIMDSFDLMEADRWDEITHRVQQACSAGFDVEDNGHLFFKEFKERLEKRALLEDSQKISTGIQALDELTYGGIKSKQLGLVVGGTGRGKTIFLTWLSRVAVLLGKRVLYITLEIPELDIAARFDSMIGKVKFGELKNHTEELSDVLGKMSQKYGTSLIIKEWPAQQASVWTIKSYIMRLSAMGMSPDLVVIDYLDLVKPHTRYNSATEDVDAITKAMHGLAKELNIAIWTASQLNRGGLAMETPDETAIAGALSKLFTCDIAIFMAQTKEERQDEMIRLILTKNRNGPAGRTISLDTDYSYMTFYRGSRDTSDGSEE